MYSLAAETSISASSSLPAESDYSVDVGPDEDMPAPLGGTESLNMSNILLYGGGLIAFFVIFGIISYIIIRKRKQKVDTTLETSQQNSQTSSMVSDSEVSQNP